MKFVWIVLLLCATSARAGTSSKVVFVGLRPLKADGATGDLGRLAEAQRFRAIAQSALQGASEQRVLGHDELTKMLEPKYLVTWFNCAGDFACTRDLLAPVRHGGYETAITGDFTITDSSYRFRFVAFTLADGKIVKEITFELPLADAMSPDAWRGNLVRILANARLRIRSNVVGTTCTIDGQPCVFESDQQTLDVMPGDHKLELTKDQYEPAIVTVNVAAETDKEIALALKPVAKSGDDKQRGPARTHRGPSLLAVRTNEVVTLDGKLDDPAWQNGWLETSFTQHFPDEKKPATQSTEVRVLYDDGAIYVGVRCIDAHPEQIVARLTRRDRDIDGDRVTVDISSKNDKASAFHFQVNAAGVQLDGIRFNDTAYNNDWDGRWYSATTIDNQGWTAELKIPLVTLRYSGHETSFGFQVRRYLGRRGEIDEWAYIPSTVEGEVSYYGSIEDIRGLKAKRLFEIVAYDSRSSILRKRQGALDGRENADSFGADIKIGLTPGLTLDSTFNPDFGTVEVDQVVLNLTTLETYFPEKRRFFIEGAELFATPFNLFYSRRIGATPPSPSVGTPVAPLPNGKIWGALKLTGVLAGRLSIAVLDALTARRDVVTERAPGDTDKVLIDPTTNFGVLRLRQDFGTNSFIGLTATAVNRIEPRDAATPQADDICPIPYATEFTALASPLPRDGRCTNDAYTAGIDTTLRTSDGGWGASAQIVGTRIAKGPTQVIPDGTSIGSGSSGFGAKVELGKYGGENWLFKIATQHLSPRFQINDAGYQDIANFHEALGSVTWRTTKPHGEFQSLSIEASVKQRLLWAGERILTDPVVTLTTQLTNLWTIQAVLEPLYPKWYEDRETQDGARTQRAMGSYGSIEVKSDDSKALVVGLFASGGKDSGDLAAIHSSLSVSLRPTPPLEIDLLANVTHDSGIARWVDTIDNMDGTRGYLFADLDARAADLTLRATYTFTRKLSLQTYLQPFVASGHYSQPAVQTVSGLKPVLRYDRFTPTSVPADALPDFREGAINLNLFVRYEYLPLSALWLVYTREQQQAAYDSAEGNGRLRFDRFTSGPTTDVLLIKLNYLWF